MYGRGRYLVSKRYPGEQTDLTSFVQPHLPAVQSLAMSLPSKDFVRNCWNWVVTNIKYPRLDLPFNRKIEVANKAMAVGRIIGQSSPLLGSGSEDFWEFPAETLVLGEGDCEDTSILLCSLLRTRIPADEVSVTVGTYDGYGHAWVKYGNLLLETTKGVTNTRPESYPYEAYVRFNDEMVMEVR